MKIAFRPFWMTLAPLLIFPVVASAVVLQQQPALAQAASSQTQNAAAQAWIDQGSQRLNAGQYAAALQLFQRAIAQFRATGNRQGEASALVLSGRVYDSTGQYPEALAVYEEALALWVAIGNADEWEGVTRNNIGLIYTYLGDYAQALEYFQQAFELRGVVGQGVALNNLGEVYRSLGNNSQALESFQRALVISRIPNQVPEEVFRQRRLEGATLGNLGSLSNASGDYAQGLEYHQQALAVHRDLGDRAGEGTTLNNIGEVYRYRADYPQALSYYRQALAIHQEIGDRRMEGTTLGNLGLVSRALGDYPQALVYYEQALAINRAIGNVAGAGTALNYLGGLVQTLGNYSQALDYFREAIALQQAIGDRSGEGQSITNFALVLFQLGDYLQSLESYQQALEIFRELGDRALVASSLNNIGVVSKSLGNTDQAREAYQEALTLQQEIGDRAGVSISLSNLGALSQEQGDVSQSLDYFQQALALQREIGDRAAEGITLNNIGFVYASQPATAITALPYYQQALAIQSPMGDRAAEATTLGNLGTVLQELGEAELAIVFLKQSVNRWESIRGDNRSLPNEQQQGFTDRVSGSYRQLADLLLQADRVLEAQEVLDLLKLQELEEYDLPGVRGTAATRQGLDFWPAEQAILDQFAASLSDGATLDFEAFLTHPAVTAGVEQLQRQARGQTLNPDQLVRLQDNLQQLGNAALLYPLILDDRLELILVTPTGLVRETVAIDRVALNAVIANFRSDITNRRSDPLPNAQQLYQWLLEPIADDLAAAGTDTILYAADGSLRYIPLAALHDGEQWLTQRYTLNHITAASLTDFTPADPTPISILAGAFPAASLAITIAGEPVWFDGLPYAQTEVQGLADRIPQTTTLFDAAFNRAALEPQLNNHSIVHLATHAEFRSGDPSDSYILLGDGDRITLADLNQWRLPQVNLVVLSACKTAVSGADLGNGEEILGFGYQIQQTGARGAIASLWYVSDGGTQLLMDSFYTALTNGYTNAAALQRAQIALITSNQSVLEGNRGADYTITDLRPEQSLVPGGDLSHPYFWAPFILIGNGL